MFVGRDRVAEQLAPLQLGFGFKLILKFILFIYFEI